MNPQQKEELIVDLITKDLINCKLVHGLQLLGVDASIYYLYLSQQVFRLMGKDVEPEETQEALHDFYTQQTLLVQQLPLHVTGDLPFRLLAQRIYEKLAVFSGQ